MSKIIFSVGTLSSGGAERVISILSNSFVQKRNEVTIMVWISAPVFYKLDDRVKIIDIQKECGSSNIVKKALFFRKYIKNKKPDILLSFLAIFNILTLISLIGVNLRKIVCERNDPRFTPLQGYLRGVRNFMYRFSDGILTQTDNNRNYFPVKLQKKTDVIYNPIFMETEFLGSALDAPKEKKVVSVARLKPQKNQMMLIKAFAEFRKSHSDYKLFIYGEGSSRKSLEKYISDNQLNDSVFLPGVRNDIFEAIKDSEMFVLSSNFEGMPNTLIEAMCLGLPCISTKVSGAVDLIKNGYNGVLVDCNDVFQMSSAISCLADDENYRFKLGENAKCLYQSLRVEKIAKQWEDYINEKMQDK